MFSGNRFKCHFVVFGDLLTSSSGLGQVEAVYLTLKANSKVLDIEHRGPPKKIIPHRDIEAILELSLQPG